MRQPLLIAFVFTTACVLCTAGGAQEDTFTYQGSWTLSQFTTEHNIPIKRFSQYLDGVESSDAEETLSDLRVGRIDARKALAAYRENEPRFIGSIAGTGMAIVFMSLLIVSLLIGLFRHMHIFDRKEPDGTPEQRSVSSVVGTITSTGNLGEQLIAAVVTAIFLHEEEVEAETRLVMTWKRASTNLWRARFAMPNESHRGTRGRRQ